MNKFCIKLSTEDEEVIKPCIDAKNAKDITLLELQNYAKINGVKVEFLFMKMLRHNNRR